MRQEPDLSDRQVEILSLISQGNTAAQVGKTLFITVDTVKTHLRRAYQTLDARSAAHAIALLYDTGRLPRA